MIKALLITLISIFFATNLSFAQVGCRTGDYIYITVNGTYFDGGSTVIKFNSTDRIIKRNFAGDPNCGIDRSTADAYSTVPGTPTNPNSKCVSDIDLSDEGQLVVYNNADKVNCSIDDHVIFLVSSIGVFGFALIRKKSR